MNPLLVRISRGLSLAPLAVLFLLLLGVPDTARAADCSIDHRPAATLLLPYFEVDPSDPSGMTTLISVNNAGTAAVLANVQLWTDLGVPTLGFQVYLTGYDVQTINLRDLFNGNLPRTAPTGEDPVGTISPQGVYSQDSPFPGCEALPYQAPPASFVTHLRAAHSGKFSVLFNGCSGQDLGDGRLRGYVTVDTVNQCTMKNPSDAGYFGAGGVATDQNVLWGDAIYLDPANKYSDGEDLVRIKSLPGSFHAGDFTFYGRYVGMSGADSRQPLATAWGSRFASGGSFAGGTDLLVWRDSGKIVKPFPCATHPAGFPLITYQEFTFDEHEQPVLLPLSPQIPGQPQIVPAPDVFPAEANKIHVGGPTFPVPYSFGWLFLDLNTPNPAAGPPSLVRQSWVQTVLKAQGQYSVGFHATPFDSVCAPLAVDPGQTGR
jgi:hypothetical protein